jgi:hypothetical protein
MSKKTLSKWLAAVVVCFMIPFCVQADINDDEIINLDQKLYVKMDQIDFCDNKIYVNVDNFIYESPAIFSDQKGYYIEKIAKSGICSWYEWQCIRCYFCNLRGVDWECRSCKKPISE